MKRIILSLLLVAFISTGFKCGGGSKDDGVFRGTLYSNHTRLTADGATIASRTPISAAFSPLVDAGFADVNRIASLPPNNYDVSDLPASRYRVWLFPRSSLCENPGFVVDATGSPYEGSEWDKDPSPTRCLICAAGMTIMQGFPTITGPGMVITDDMGIMRTIVRYEAEHSILFYKDSARYVETQYHTNGQGHPILGEGPPVSIAEGTPGKAAPIVQFKNFQAVSIELPVDIAAGDGIAAAKGQRACVLLTR